MVAWRRRGDVPEPATPWLYGIARRVLADHWRARRIRPIGVPMAEGTEVAVADGGFEAMELVHDLRRAFDELSDPDREILRLVTWEELDLAAAARVLGCSRTAAAVRLFRARRRLTRLLETATREPASTIAAAVRGGTP